MAECVHSYYLHVFSNMLVESASTVSTEKVSLLLGSLTAAADIVLFRERNTIIYKEVIDITYDGGCMRRYFENASSKQDV